MVKLYYLSVIICSLFNDPVSSLDYIASNVRMAVSNGLERTWKKEAVT
jgi:hypothetical protein